ncbi:hypothetical protein DMUE_1665 [Dictyocoela muelleri]|nr:hypothetical protein DMUE_1665 [Dictyocoela muelleri]
MRWIKRNSHYDYKNDMIFRKVVKYCYLLAFIPVENVKIEFEKIKLLSNNSVTCNEFLIYFENDFILNVGKKGNKNLNLWSVNERIHNNIPYTTNSCEAYHRHLNTKIIKKDRPIGTIISILQKEEQRVRLLIESLRTGKIRQKLKLENVKIILSNYKHYDGYEIFEILASIFEIFMR